MWRFSCMGRECVRTVRGEKKMASRSVMVFLIVVWGSALGVATLSFEVALRFEFDSE